MSFPPSVLSTSAGLAVIQQEATLCLSDLEEWLSDFAELGNHIHIWQPTRHKGERPLPFIIYFKENIMVRWFALSVINNNPPPLNSALMHIKKCSGRGSFELILRLLTGLKMKTSALLLNDIKELTVTVDDSVNCLGHFRTPLKVLDWVGRTFKCPSSSWKCSFILWIVTFVASVTSTCDQNTTLNDGPCTERDKRSNSELDVRSCGRKVLLNYNVLIFSLSIYWAIKHSHCLWRPSTKAMAQFSIKEEQVIQFTTLGWIC